jgi:hypothetical protein
MVDRVGLGQVFSKYFGFPCQFSFHQLLHIHHHQSSGATTIGQLVTDGTSGLSLIPPQEVLDHKSGSVQVLGFSDKKSGGIRSNTQISLDLIYDVLILVVILSDMLSLHL